MPTSLRFVLVLIAAACVSPISSLAQTVRPQKVFMSGENPFISLRNAPDGIVLARASFWRIHWSPVGTGHVCFVTVGEQNTPGAIRVAVTDNPRLAEYLTTQVLATFDRSYTDWPFTPVAGATFGRSGDSTTEHRETCRAPGYDVALSWGDLQTPALVDILPGSRPGNPFGITYLRIPAGRASIAVNGKPAPGRSMPSGSFLAFGETWIK